MGKQETDDQMGGPASVGEVEALQQNGHPNRIPVVEEFLMGMDYPGHLLCRINCVVWNVWGVLMVGQLGLSDENKCRLLPVTHQTSEISLWATVARISGLHDEFLVWMFVEIQNVPDLLRENAELISEE